MARAIVWGYRHRSSLANAVMSDPFSINGDSIIAVQGKDCVGITWGLRLGPTNLDTSNTLARFSCSHDGCRNELFRFKTDIYRLREERRIEPKSLAHLVSSTLYEMRFSSYIISLVVPRIHSITMHILFLNSITLCVSQRRGLDSVLRSRHVELSTSFYRCWHLPQINYVGYL